MDQAACMQTVQAFAGLTFTTSTDSVRQKADVLEKLGPPDQVKAAIEYFATNGGVQKQGNSADDDKNGNIIQSWLTPMCPESAGPPPASSAPAAPPS